MEEKLFIEITKLEEQITTATTELEKLDKELKRLSDLKMNYQVSLAAFNFTLEKFKQLQNGNTE